MTASSRESEQSLATQPQAPAWRARAARRGSSRSASTTVRVAGWLAAHPLHEGDAVGGGVGRAVGGAGRGGRVRFGGPGCGQVGEGPRSASTSRTSHPSAVGGGAFEDALGRGRAAGRRDLDVGFGRECCGE